MKTNVRSKNKNKIIVFAVPIVIIAIMALGCVATNGHGFFDDDNKLSQNVKVEDGNHSGDGSVVEDDSLPILEEEKGITHDRPSTGDTLSVWVTTKNVVDGVLRVRVQIDQNIGSGTCELVINDYSVSVPTVFEPQSASCQGFDVPIGSYTGNNFTVTVRSGNKTGSTAGVING